MKINILDKLSPNFHDVAVDCINGEIDEIALDGGRGSCKSSFASLIIIFCMMKDYHYDEEFTNTVVIRKVQNTLLDSVYTQLLWAIDCLQVNDVWKCTKSPMKMIYLPSGQEILFRGCDDPMKIKSTKFKKGYCKYVWFEEYDQFDGPNEIAMVNQTLIRGKQSLIQYTYNAPPEDDHWVNLESTLNLEDRIQHHSDYRTVPKEWLGPKFIKMAERKKETNIHAYNNQYLGLITGVGGNVFKNVQRITLSDYEITQLENCSNGLDFGFAVDPVHFQKCKYGKNKLWLFDEINEIELSTRDLVKKIVKKTFSKELIKADSEEPRTINSLVKDYYLNVVACKKGKDSVRHGIKFLQDLDTIYIDKVRCPNAYSEFKFYKYKKDKDGNYINEFPDKKNHSIDATRYALDDVILQYGWRMPKVNASVGG